jgi:hypothetical protein
MIQQAREERDARIRELHDDWVSQRDIAKEVGCSLGLVNTSSGGLADAASTGGRQRACRAALLGTLRSTYRPRDPTGAAWPRPITTAQSGYGRRTRHRRCCAPN